MWTTSHTYCDAKNYLEKDCFLSLNEDMVKEALGWVAKSVWFIGIALAERYK